MAFPLQADAGGDQWVFPEAGALGIGRRYGIMWDMLLI